MTQIEVVASVSKTGQIKTLGMNYKGLIYKVDRVLSCAKGNTFKAKFEGYRYICKVGNKQITLILDSDDCWWIND